MTLDFFHLSQINYKGISRQHFFDFNRLHFGSFCASMLVCKRIEKNKPDAKMDRVLKSEKVGIDILQYQIIFPLGECPCLSLFILLFPVL